MAKKEQKIAIAILAGTLLVLGLTMVGVKYERHVHSERLQGAWEGLLQHHAGPLMRKQRMVLKIFKENGSYYAAFDQIDNGTKNIPATKLDIGGSSVAFELSNGFTYQGRLDGEATEITGRWKWPGGNFSLPLRLVRTATPDTVPEPLTEAEYTPRPGSDLQGLWKGTLKVGNDSLRLHLKIAQSDDGNFRAELNSIDQPPIIAMPITTMEYRNPSVKFSLQGFGAAYHGQLRNGNSQIVGTWTQGLNSPLTFERAGSTEEPALEDGNNFKYASESELQGHWTGTLPGRYGLHLRVVFNIGQHPDGSFSGTLDSPDQSLFAMPFDTLMFSPPNVHMENKSANCTFDGKLLEGKLSGVWVFNKKTTDPLTLEREKPVKPSP